MSSRRTIPTFNVGNNAALVQLSGGIGRGISKAGRRLADLGGDYSKQNEEELKRAERKAEKESAEALVFAKNQAQGAKNRALHPELSKKITSQFQKSSDGETALGFADLGEPTEKKLHTVGKALVDSEGHAIYTAPAKPLAYKVSETGELLTGWDDGTVTNTGKKVKTDWNQPRSAKNNRIPSSQIPEVYNSRKIRKALYAKRGITRSGNETFVDKNILKEVLKENRGLIDLANTSIK